MLKKQVKHCCELGLDAISIFGNAAEEVEQNHNSETCLDYTWPAVPLGNQTKLDSSCGFLALAGQAGFIQTENDKIDLLFDDWVDCALSHADHYYILVRPGILQIHNAITALDLFQSFF